MDEFFKWLAGNPIAMIILLVAVGLAVIICVVAFFQGREVSFWKNIPESLSAYKRSIWATLRGSK